MAKRRIATSAAQMSQAYMILMSILTAVIVVASLTTVGTRLVHNKQVDAKDLMATLQESFADNTPDWDYWRATANINMHTTYVRVKVHPTNHKARYYYTRRTKAFLADNPDTWALSSHIVYQDDRGVFYHLLKHRTVNHVAVSYEIWLSLNNMLGLFELLVFVIVGVSLVALVVGLLAIRVLARRLNQPLVDLTHAATAITEAQDQTYHETLPVPAGPEEVSVLGTEFNRLLQSLNRQVIRDHQFVSDASHELRTPIAAIRGHVGLIRRHAAAHPEIIPDSLATIEAESLKMQKLIERLLSLSRMDHAHLANNWFDVVPVVQDVAEQYPTPEPMQLKVVAPKQALAYANADSISQVLVALINNAVKYAQQGAVTLTVTQRPGEVRIAVADLGPGIPDAAKDKVFDRFYRVDASREKKIGGTGLGLAIAERLVALNNGSLRVVDNHPHGAVFIVTLPGSDQV